MGDPADQSHLDARFRVAVASGDFAKARGQLAAIRAGAGPARPYELELDAARWLAGRPGAHLPAPEDVRAMPAPSVGAPLARVACHGIRAALLAFDGALAERWLEVHRAMAPSGAAAEPSVRLHAATAWVRLLRGDHPGAEAAATEGLRAARAAGLGAVVVELQAALALIALGRGDAVEATSAARTAFRMARSEGNPADEFLATLVLARVRRASGAPHLAVRILRTLHDLASAPFLPWLEHELALAGAQDEWRTRGPASALSRLRRALGQRGDGVDPAAEELRAHTAGFPDLRAEVDDLVAALHPALAADVSTAMAEWLAGVTHVVPRGLHGLGTTVAATGAPVVAYVVASPGAHPTRVLAIGVGAVPAARGATRIDPERRPQERTDAAIALLALRTDPLDEEAFFQQLYGFGYRPELHSSVISSLLHRVRSTLEAGATLERTDGTLRLALQRPLVVWDPRCQQPLEDRILGVLTRGAPTTARAAADSLGMPLRTVQAALGQLVDSGACRRDRHGRAVEYRVEDTTFSEPTVTRARAWREETAAGSSG